MGCLFKSVLHLGGKKCSLQCWIYNAYFISTDQSELFCVTLNCYTMQWEERFTVTAEKATKHNAASRKRNIPPSEGFRDFSSSWIYLQESTVYCQKHWCWRSLRMQAFILYTHSIMFWWWRTQPFSCSSLPSGPGPSPEPCTVFNRLSPIKEIFARSFSNWLQATHTRVANNPWKPINTLVIMTYAVYCHSPKSKLGKLL